MQTKTNTMTELDERITEIAGRIRALREIMGFSEARMAALSGVSEEEYLRCEAGEENLTFAFIYKCAQAFGIDVTELMTGDTPRLRSYTVTRKGMGSLVDHAHGMTYFSLASGFRDRISEPLFVECKYDSAAESQPIELTTHRGQECDIVISGTLRVQIGEHIEELHAGDCAYYNSETPHGMVAVGGRDCCFYAIVLTPGSEASADAIIGVSAPRLPAVSAPKAPHRSFAYEKFIEDAVDANGTPTFIRFQNEDSFNFAFDIVDVVGKERPDKTAMVYLSEDMREEKRFTFGDMRHESARAANYFRALGIKKGDRVMLVLRRHYPFWFAILGLNKIGAIAIPATTQLLTHDFEYRFEAAGVRAILCSGTGDIANQVDAARNKPALRILVNGEGEREGWHSFDEEYRMYSSHYERKSDAPAGDDPMLAFFTSGTTGYPKLAVHNYKYALGHYHTAKYWHCVDPDGLHLTISDTGWAKAMWGKLYGQWLCEAATFVYDFDRFDAAKILPLFAKYHITTFCAPPTMYRMLIKQDLSQYDFSSLKHATTAGEALNPEVFRCFKEITGLSIMDGFGQSESTCMIANLVGQRHKLGSMGRPCPIYDIALLDPDGKPVKDGESGEICVSLANGRPCGLFLGYYGNPDKTAEVMHDGYYHTGDVAWRDEDGFYWYVGRADDVIKSSGYRIGPFEIESVIMELPYVLECGVSAAPDEVRGQVVKASVVLVKGTEPTELLKKEIQNYVKQHTAPYKYPRIVEFRDELPKTVSGKIIRNQL
ncbi:MAG: AMP-binding protein [Clostridia bacterium]|nr:AMP-binding protein [Clostridia bacterium]